MRLFMLNFVCYDWSVDPFVLTFYAVICAGLSWAAPNLGRPAVRLGVGAVVGVLAAALLPTVRASLGL
jgi:hypothetical protein